MNPRISTTTNSLVQDRRHEPTDARRKYLIIHLAGQAYGLPLVEVERIIPLAELSRPPACPPVLAGFLDLGGSPVPVIHLRHLFGLPAAPAELYTPLVLVHTVDRRLALWVDRVSRTVTVDADAMVPLDDGHTFNPSVAGLLIAGESDPDSSSVLLLCVARLLLEQEGRYLAELEAIEQARLAQWREVRP